MNEAAKTFERLRKETNEHLYLLVGLYGHSAQNVFAEMVLYRAQEWCRYMGLDYRQVRASNRHKQYVQLRGVIFYVLYIDCGLTCTEIGRRMKRNHATVLYHVREVQYQLKHYEDIRTIYRHLKHGL